MQKSLSQEVLQRSLLRWDEYAFPTTLAGGIDQIDAPCFLCVLVSITDTKTRATVYQAFQQLTNLRNILANTPGYDIAAFHVSVEKLKQVIIANGRTAPDSTYTLLQAYEVVPDKTFGNYVERKRTDFEEDKPLTEVQLTSAMDAKYRALKSSGDWCRDQEDSNLVALNSRISSLETSRQSRVVSSRDNFSPSARTGRGGRSGRGGGRSGRGRGRGGRGTSKGGSNSQPGYPPAWARHFDGDQIQRDGKTWYWCRPRGYYCLHTPQECKAPNAASSSSQPISAAQRIAAAAAAISADDE